MPRRQALLALLSLLPLLSLTTTSCKKKELKKWAWVDAKLSGPDLAGLTCTSELRATVLVLDCDNVPAGSTFTIRGKQRAASGKLHEEIDVGDAVGAFKVSDRLAFNTKWNPQVPLVIALPTGTIKTEVPPVYLGVALKAGVGKSLTFGAEPAAKPNAAGPSVLWLGLTNEVFGPAATLRDVDWVAAENPEPVTVNGPICKYRDPRTGAVSSAPLTLLVDEVIVYDRRTARVVDRKQFYAVPACPSEKDKRDKTVVNGPSEDTKKQWVAERRTKK